MVAFTLSRVFPTPQDVTFDTITDLRNAAEAIAGITALEVLTDGPIGAGTRFRETRVMFKRECTEEMEITQFDRPDSYTVECKNHGCHYTTVFTLRPEGDGTAVEMVFDAKPLTTMAKVMGFLTRPLMKSCVKVMERDLIDLQQRAIARAAQDR